MREKERGRRGGERERSDVRNIDQLPPVHVPAMHPSQRSNHNPGMCFDLMLYLQDFGIWNDAPTY